MSFSEWFSHECFAAVQEHDHHCSQQEGSFCNLFEVPQNGILQMHFENLDGLRTCKQGLPYPNGKKSDLFIETDAGIRMYCELKAMYKTWFKKHGRPYPAYLWSPFRNPSKENSAGFDLAKLATYPDRNTTHIALVILGSSLPVDRMDKDLDTFAEMAGIDTTPWESYRAYWPNHWYGGYYYDIRVWICEWKNVPQWWASIIDVFRSFGFSGSGDGAFGGGVEFES